MRLPLPTGNQFAVCAVLAVSRSSRSLPMPFEKPSVADLRHAAEQLGMNPSMLYLNTVQDIVAPLVAAYAALDAIPDDKPAVKYPRDGGRRPTPEENPLGAWYVKTAIKGKPGGKLAGRRVALKDNVCLA